MRSLRELMNLQGRVALITGGAGHLGRAMGEALAELGCGLVVLDAQAEGARATAADFAKRFSVPTTALAVDLADDAALARVPAQIREAHGRLDVLINNAGFVGTTKLTGWCVPFPDQSIDTWRKVMDVNLAACFSLIQACTPLLETSPGPSIINIATIYALVGPDLRIYEGTGMGNPAAYTASKAGLLALTRYLSTVLSPKIRVNAITPGGVARGQAEPFVKAYLQRTPMGRMAIEEDFKGAAAYLASDLSAYMTGQNLILDGGWTAW